MPRRRRNRPARPEDEIQREVFNHLRQRPAPGTFAFHCPNGGKRPRIEAAIMKGLGVVAGVPDVVLIAHGHIECMELKAPGNGLTDAQKATHEALRRAGVNVVTINNLNQAIRYLETNGYLKGVMT